MVKKGQPALIRFPDGYRMQRIIGDVRDNGEFRLVGGADWWRQDKMTATRIGRSVSYGVISLSEDNGG